ncbi:hypothetical protein D9613_002764 [Agrocybe pediades]|uniref:DNA-directed DNA polymerase n=1 Tax=Agrocybe pediades TaxID=84607 RepID=A0A8H4QQA5_9AGAR|nr:hypothetical protein D9613_002764 [Agrocybe pediades]
MSKYANVPIPSTLERPSTVVLPPDGNTPSFVIGSHQKSYKHQYSNIYFIRLRLLRDCVQEQARKKWATIAGNPTLIPRVLEVEKGKLCYVIGTVYMDMPLKPNVMEDIGRDQSIAPPPPLKKFCSADDSVMLEDESGRIKLVGERVNNTGLVTGVIIGALGMETPNGEFEVIDICCAEMAPQPSTEASAEDKNAMDVDDENKRPDEWIAVISGLDVGSTSPSDGQIQMLAEYLTGEGCSVKEQVSASQISRLIVAGDSLAAIELASVEPVVTEDKKSRRYGQETLSFSPQPILTLSSALHDLAMSMPIHILPGESDPSGTILPQQPFPRAMFGDASRFPTMVCETNPTYLTIATGSEESEDAPSKPLRNSIKRKLLVNSGQPLNDMFKYLTKPHTRLSILESTLRWRHMAPTAPDTLWCHPYFAEDPFLLTETPDIYIVGGQKRFRTKLVSQKNSSKDKNSNSTRCRIIMVPSFAETGILVLVNLRTLAVKCVDFSVHGMSTGGREKDEEQVPRPASPVLEEQQPLAPKTSMDYGYL